MAIPDLSNGRIKSVEMSYFYTSILYFILRFLRMQEITKFSYQKIDFKKSQLKLAKI